MDARLQEIIDKINHKLASHTYGNQPTELYEPIRYILTLGGKRLRPLLTVLAYQMYQGDDTCDDIIVPAMAVEVFHNFTLMHDDIMDEAPLRRGKPTVHEKWNSNIAILSGDVMMVQAYDLLLGVPAKRLPEVMRAFNRCAAEVCEGQQWDMNFERRDVVTVEEYIDMIRQKTAVLLGFSLQLGGVLAGASPEDYQHLYNFGVNIGISFQLKDDLLDVYADQAKFGKQVGGDIIANKKTFLLIRALENASPQQRAALDDWLNRITFEKEVKVEAVRKIYDELNIKGLTQEKMTDYFNTGMQHLQQVGVDDSRKEMLRHFAEELMARDK